MNQQKEIINSISRLNVVIVKHTFTTGGAEDALRDFLNDNKVNKLAYISHPFSYATPLNSKLILYKKGRQIKEMKAPPIKGPDLLFYIKDLFFTIFFMFRLKAKFDLYVGVDNLNAFVGLVLKKLGLVRKVIFYTIDYAPKRFDNKLLNKIYHLIDKVCCYKCDFVWNLSPVMAEERNKRGVLLKKSAPQITVPMGAHFNKTRRLSFKEINRNTIVYMGHLRENQGVDFLISAFPEVLKVNSKARLLIVGTGHLESQLKKLALELGMGQYIEFTGMIESHTELEQLLATCAIGVAPYVPNPDSFTLFADPGKPKVYMATGLPVVITKVPQIAYEIERGKTGIAINYDRKELVDAITLLLSDDHLYKEYRENAIRFASQYSWEKIFEDALGEVLKEDNLSG